MAGRDLSRQSSFERMMRLVATSDGQNEQSARDRNKSATELQLWWMKHRKLLQTVNNIREADVKQISESLATFRSNTNDFNTAQKVLSDSQFISSVNSFLSNLPLDPALKAKNSISRSPHTIGSALFIHYFPDEVLLDDEVADLSREAEECSVGAAMLVSNFSKFIANCAVLVPTISNEKTANFKKAMLSFRFSMRYFIEKLERWKELDSSRLLHSLESPYLESYSIFFTISKAMEATGTNETGKSDSDDDTDMNIAILHAAEQQCLKIKQAMIKILGTRAQAKIEELNAQVEAAHREIPLPSNESAVEADDSSYTGITRIENSHAGVVANTSVSVSASSTSVSEEPDATPAGFKEISIILKRIAAAGGFKASHPTPSGAGIASNEPFQVGDERHQLLHELSLDPTHRLPEGPSPGDIDLQFYSQYYLPAPPSNDIVRGGWSHMIQSASFPRSLNPLRINVPQGGTGTGARTGAEVGTGADEFSAVEPMSAMESNMTKLKSKIKSTMLFMMDDNIVCSLSRSPVAEEGLQKIETGAIIPVLYNMNASMMILSSRVIAVNRETLIEGSSGTAAILSLDVMYLCDNTVEKGVLLGRVKMANDVPSPAPFLLALQDILNRVAGLTPNRSDLHSELTASVDFDLWMQMLSHGAMTPRDVGGIFAHLFECISKLQAPVRAEPFTAWTNGYLRLISSCRSFDTVIPLLPIAFEFAGASVDEIRRDIANYHVTTLLPVLRPPVGPSFLSQCIMHSLLSIGTMHGSSVSLDNTMSLLVSLLSPTQRHAEVIAEVLEATGETLNIRDLSYSNGNMTSDTVTDADTQLSMNSSAVSAPEGHVPLSTPVAATGPRTSINVAVIALSMLRLLQLPVRLTSPFVKAQVLPETFLFDGQRLSFFRDLVDIISVQCTVVITIRQALQKIGLLSTEAEETSLYARLNVLLRDSTVDMKVIVTEAIRFVRETKNNSRVRVVPGAVPPLDGSRATSPLAIRYISPVSSLSAVPGSGSISGPRSPPRTVKSSEPDSSEFEETLEKSLKNVLAEGNPVLQLFTRRIYKVLLRALLGQPYTSRLPSLSLHAKGIQRNLSELISRALRLFSLHCSVYENVYSMIFASNTFQTHVFPDPLTDVD